MTGFPSKAPLTPQKLTIQTGIKAVPTYDETRGEFVGARSVLRLQIGNKAAAHGGFFDVACKVGGSVSGGLFGSLGFLVQKIAHVYVPLDTLTENGEQIYVNVNSVVNRLGLSKEEVILRSSEGTLFQGMQDQVEKKVAKLETLISRDQPMTDSMNRVASFVLQLDLTKIGKDQVIQVTDKRFVNTHTWECIDLGKVLGQGTFGSVREVSYLGSKKIGALKMPHEEIGKYTLEYETIENLIRAAKVEGRWPEGVLRFYEPIHQVADLRTGEVSSVRYIVSEQCECNGREMLKRREGVLSGLKGEAFNDRKQELFRLNIKDIASVFSGYDWLGRNNINLRDIKPENILFRSDKTVVVSDIDPQATDERYSLASDFRGLDNASPKQVKNRLEKMEVFAMGCLAYDMLRLTADKKACWVGDNLAEKIKSGLYDVLSSGIKLGYPDCPELTDFLVQMINPNYNLRPTIEESANFFKLISASLYLS